MPGRVSTRTQCAVKRNTVRVNGVSHHLACTGSQAQRVRPRFERNCEEYENMSDGGHKHLSCFKRHVGHTLCHVFQCRVLLARKLPYSLQSGRRNVGNQKPRSTAAALRGVFEISVASADALLPHDHFVP